MKNPPTPNANINKNNTITEKIIVQDDMIFSVQFITKQNSIQIECNKTNSNEKYIINLTLKDWKDLNNYLSSLNNISNIFNQIEKLDNKEFSIVKEKNEIKLEIKFYDEYQSYPVIITLEENKNNKSKDLESNEIIEENKILKNKNKSLEERIEVLEDYINKFILSLPYNSFDINLYELEKVFHNLKHSDLMSNRECLGFINSGIKKLLKKKIADCTLAYKFTQKENKNVPKKFREICENLNNILIIVKTYNDKTFGAFYKKDINDKYNDNNNISNYPIYSQNNHIIENMFDSRKYIKNAFVFSLDKSKIYYSDDSFKDLYENPGFQIKYDNNEAYLFGNEYKVDHLNYINNQNRIIGYEHIVKQYQTPINNNPKSILTKEAPQMKMPMNENKTTNVNQIQNYQNTYQNAPGVASIKYNQNTIREKSCIAGVDYGTVDLGAGAAIGYGAGIELGAGVGIGFAGVEVGYGGYRGCASEFSTSATTTTTTISNQGYNNNNNVNNYNNDNKSYILSELQKFHIFNLEVFNINLKE